MSLSPSWTVSISSGSKTSIINTHTQNPPEPHGPFPLYLLYSSSQNFLSKSISGNSVSISSPIHSSTVGQLDFPPSQKLLLLSKLRPPGAKYRTPLCFHLKSVLSSTVILAYLHFWAILLFCSWLTGYSFSIPHPLLLCFHWPLNIGDSPTP